MCLGSDNSIGYGLAILLGFLKRDSNPNLFMLFDSPSFSLYQVLHILLTKYYSNLEFYIQIVQLHSTFSTFSMTEKKKNIFN